MADDKAERARLSEFLESQRESLIAKLQGLDDDQARLTPTVSDLSLLGLVKHSSIWERRWFQVILAGQDFTGQWPEVGFGDNAATFDLALEDTVESVVAEYRAQIAISNEIMAGLALDAPCALRGADEDLRWVALHMIEETARHAGHADILRETIDGSQGRGLTPSDRIVTSPGDVTIRPQ